MSELMFFKSAHRDFQKAHIAQVQAFICRFIQQNHIQIAIITLPYSENSDISSSTMIKKKIKIDSNIRHNRTKSQFIS